MTEKTRLLCLGDHMLSPSGVGTQSKYLAEALVKSGKYQVLNLGGAIQHSDYTVRASEEYGQDFVIKPVNGYGNPDLIRQALIQFKPHALFFITDPRFYVWLWEMEDEIHNVCPMLYWHVWDNYPVPDFNNSFYKSTDFVGCISKLTHNILCELGHENKSGYIPHAVPTEIFKVLEKSETETYRKQFLKQYADRFVIFWINRNARRKKPSDVLHSVKLACDAVGYDKIVLFMHTNPKDPEGPDLLALRNKLGLNNNVIFSNGIVSNSEINTFMNISDVTINIANAEGFGLGTLESMMAGTPIIVSETGGLQDQIFDDEGEPLGVCIQPAAKSDVGSQSVPYIYEDIVTHQQACDAILYMYRLKTEKPDIYDELSHKCSIESAKRFQLGNMINSWDTAIQDTISNFNKNYVNFRLTEV